MTNSTKVIIYDSEGNVILNDIVTSPFVGLQTGESFWFGSGSQRTWGKVTKLTYGLDTSSKQFVIEIIIEKSNKQPTKSLQKTSMTNIDTGEIIITERIREWQSDDKKIKINCRKVEDAHMWDVILQVETPWGPVIADKSLMGLGDTIVAKNQNATITATFLKVINNKGDYNAYARVIGQIKIKHE